VRPTVKTALTLVTAALLAGCAATASSTGTAAPSTARSGNVEATSPGPAIAPHCGVERWAVKTGTDPAAGQVDVGHPTPTTVGWLASRPVPASWSEDSPRIAGSPEMTAYTVTATLVKYKEETDSDYHLVLSWTDPATGRVHTMIAEIPAPPCAAGSPWLAAITHARKQFDAVFTASQTSWTPAGVPVTVTGVGFFDALHGQTGVAPNGIELHPALDILVGNPNTPVPSDSATPAGPG
jgi:hypothetical protein